MLRLAKRSVCVALVCVMAGCATSDEASGAPKRSASTPEDSPLESWAALFQKNDIAGLSAMYSDAFKSQTLENKAAVAAWLKEGDARGQWKGSIADTSEARRLPKGNRESDGPVRISGPFGSADVYLEFVREDGAWRVTQMTMQQY